MALSQTTPIPFAVSSFLSLWGSPVKILDVLVVFGLRSSQNMKSWCLFCKNFLRGFSVEAFSQATQTPFEYKVFVSLYERPVKFLDVLVEHVLRSGQRMKSWCLFCLFDKNSKI